MDKYLVVSASALPKEVNMNRVADYDIVKNLTELQDFIYNTPRIYSKLFVDEGVVPFNTTSLHLLYKNITTGFLNIKEEIVYITVQNKQDVTIVFDNIFKEFKYTINVVKELNSGSITDAINGKDSLQKDQTYTEIHRVKLKDYVEQNGDKLIKQEQAKFDDRLLKTDNQAKVEITSKKTNIDLVYVDKYAATVFASLIYNNLKTNYKVFMADFDKFNYLSDYMLKLDCKDYITKVIDINDDKSTLLLSTDINKTSYTELMRYVYNTTNFDAYINILNIEEVKNTDSNTFYVLTPTAESTIKLISNFIEDEITEAKVVLVYKGFIGINELTQQQFINTIESSTNVKINLESYIIRGGEKR